VSGWGSGRPAFQPLTPPRACCGSRSAREQRRRRVRVCVNPERFKCLLLQINADQMLVEELGPIIERWVARDPDNPNALEVLTWLMRLRLKIRQADPRTYAAVSCRIA
jgi:hypothetical protein